MLDQLSRGIKTCLDALLREADKLRQALTALGSRDASAAASPKTRFSAAQTPSPRRAKAALSPAASPRQTKRSRAGKPGAASSSRQSTSRSTTPAGAAGDGARSAPGATKRAVLAALADGKAMIAGEIATATGLGRPSVSTTLSRLAKTGQLTKVARGYQIASPANQAPTDASPDPTAT